MPNCPPMERNCRADRGSPVGSTMSPRSQAAAASRSRSASAGKRRWCRRDSSIIRSKVAAYTSSTGMPTAGSPPVKNTSRNDSGAIDR